MNKKWQKKEFTYLSIPIMFLDFLLTGNTKSIMKKNTDNNLLERKWPNKKKLLKEKQRENCQLSKYIKKSMISYIKIYF